MEFSSVTYIAYFSALILSLILTGVLLFHAKSNKIYWSFALAAAIHSCWLLVIDLCQQWPDAITIHIVVLFEALHYSGWIFALAYTTNYLCNHCLPRYFLIFLTLFCGSAILIGLSKWIGQSSNASMANFMIWQGLCLSVIGLLNLEQLYRNVLNLRIIKLFCLSLAALFTYDAYFFAHSLIFNNLNPELWQARAAISIIAIVLMTVGTITLKQQNIQSANLTFSRPIAFYTTSLTGAGILLSVLAIGGYYVRLYGGDWGSVIYSLLLMSAIMLLAIVFTSRSVRESLSVLISKHLFSHKYDYRSEWLKLINQLSQPTNPKDVHTRAICAVASIFKSPGGALWLKRGKVLAPVHQVGMNVDIIDAIELSSSKFCRALQDAEWVFFPNSAENSGLNQYNEHLPDWASRMTNLWLILPLLNEIELVGFMVLMTPKRDASLNWEDLDLLKTVGKQVANYLERHEQAEQLAESRQFDAFNRLAAYVMHDLKNLIAQQSLVVKNAEKHKDNPAFIEDAIQTINNSVLRMNNLLRKLQHNEPEEVRTLHLNQVLIEATKRCQNYQPAPTIRAHQEDIKLNADWDSLVMVFTHIIQNAQDATDNNGFVDVDIEKEDKMVTIIIEDNGSGMDPSFIRDRLFKPFDTTKTGKGMGIGVYQARDYVQSLGGNLSVESQIDIGTTIQITLPTL